MHSKIVLFSGKFLIRIFIPHIQIIFLWLIFLQIQTDYRALNTDHWRNFYRFFKEVMFFCFNLKLPCKFYVLLIFHFWSSIEVFNQKREKKRGSIRVLMMREINCKNGSVTFPFLLFALTFKGLYVSQCNMHHKEFILGRHMPVMFGQPIELVYLWFT